MPFKIKNLYVEYTDGTVALKNINLKTEKEKCIGILGTNGAGKSSLLSAIPGLVPQKGDIFVDETQLSEKSLNEMRRKVGMVFQNPEDRLFMPTVYEDLLFGPENYGFDKKAPKKPLKNCLRP